MSSTLVMGAGLCLAGLTGHGICEGWNAAGTIASGSAGSSSIALPLYMTGTLKGAAAGILAGVVCKQTAMRSGLVAASVALLTPIAATVSLAQVPLNDIPNGFLIDPSGITSKAVALVGGALLVLSLQVMAPIATRSQSHSSVKGLLSGVACASIVFGVRGAICMLSTLCIHAP